ncbi:hypothetical protein V9K67_09370 [Paraflavisolibacter sp. H34]|uniref:hypothetical protein n=1 Tax=Huijunlia imazamoxiresistens TaxID=3127457 RepID=UPI0030171464
MKRSFMLGACLLCAGFVFGQAEDGTVVYNKTAQPAAVLSLPYSAELVNAAMEDYLSKKGSRAGDLKGFKTFRNTQLAQGDSLNADLYFKVTRKSRSEKDASTVYLLVGIPPEATATPMRETYLTREQAKTFLNGLVPVIEAYNLETLIRAQNEVVIKEEKKYRSLQEEGNDLEKRKTDMERKITANKQDQEAQNTEVERQKQALAQLAGQRKP